MCDHFLQHVVALYNCVKANHVYKLAFWVALEWCSKSQNLNILFHEETLNFVICRATLSSD